MAFTVEDGTGVEDANSYVAVATADAYHADRGNTAWANGSSQNKQIALIKATDYVEQRWGGFFKGTKEFTDAPLSFPRLNLYDRAGVLVEGVPQKLKYAVCEYALRVLNGTALFLEPTTDPTGLKVVGVKKVVGPLETSTQYSESAVSTIKAFPAADKLLSEFLSYTTGVIRA